jgi:tetratricopeptide (TPR) repeat protein
LADNLKLLLRLFWQPAAAMSAILDRGSLLFASLAALAVGVLLGTAMSPWVGFRFYTPLFVLGAVYVPGLVLLARLFTGSASFQRDYAALLTCAAMGWSAANLPLVAALWFAPQIAGALAGAAYLYFLVLMFFAVRTVFGSGSGASVAVVALSWLPLVALAVLWGPVQLVLRWVASPFFLLFAYYYLGAELGNLGAGLRRRQHFRRMLEAATINPHDGEAQYQLGLIHQQRRQYTEAVRRFERAVAIDPELTDAHFQLGCIARKQGRLGDALAHFQKVMDQNDRHSQSEILRELGAVYLAARQWEDARSFLAEYIGRREYDPEGLFYLGQALEGLGRTAEAREMYARAIESARTAPRFRRRMASEWSRLAQKQIRKIV